MARTKLGTRQVIDFGAMVQQLAGTTEIDDASALALSNALDSNNGNFILIEDFIARLRDRGMGDYAAGVAIQRALGLSLIAESCDKVILNTTMTMTASRFYAIPIYVPIKTTITGVRWFKHGIGSYVATSKNNKVGLYSYSAGTLTLIKASTDSNNVWQQGNDTIDSVALSSTQAVNRGVYWIGFLWRNDSVTTAPSLKSGGNLSASMVSAGFTNSGKLAAYIDAQTDLPASIAMSTMTSLINTLWFGLY